MAAEVQKAGRRSGRRGGPFTKYGVPMLSLMVLGYVAVGHVLQGRRDLSQARDDEEWLKLRATQSLTKEGPMAAPASRKPPLSLDDELRELRKKVDIDAFEYKPVPKPREPSSD